MKFSKERFMEKLNELEGEGISKFWKPSTGKNVARILPYPYDLAKWDGYLFPELYMHFGLPGGSIVCLEKVYGEECPICQYVDTLADDARNDGEIWKVMKRIESKVQPMVPVLLKENDGKNKVDATGASIVKIWRMNKTCHKDCYNKAANEMEEYDEVLFLDVNKGVDVVVVVEEPKGGKKWGDTSITFRSKQSKLAESKEEIKAIMAKIPNVNELYTKKSKDDLVKVLNKYLQTGEEEVQTGSSRHLDAPFDEEDAAVKADVHTDLDDKLNDILGIS